MFLTQTDLITALTDSIDTLPEPHRTYVNAKFLGKGDVMTHPEIVKMCEFRLSMKRKPITKDEIPTYLNNVMKPYFREVRAEALERLKLTLIERGFDEKAVESLIED